MRDEEYVYYQDVREKKVTGYSARKQRSHCGKAGCKLPSDYLTKKENKNMSGECKSYRLNEPMDWKEFKQMPDDLKVAYILAIREKYNAPDRYIFNMLGTSDGPFKKETARLGIDICKTRSGRMKWDKEDFIAWANRVPAAAEAPAAEEEEIMEEAPIVEEDLPWDAPAEAEQVPAPVHEPVLLTIPFCAVPESGTMTFTGDADRIVNTLSTLFKGAKIKMNVHWDVLEG